MSPRKAREIRRSNDDSNEIFGWLKAASEPWVVYNTLVDLEEQELDSREVRAAYEALGKHPKVKAMIGELNPWPPTEPLSRAYDPKDSIWKLNTLADFGLRRDIKSISAISDRVLAAQAENGGFLHGGFDHTKSWHERPYVCIAHVMTYALARFGYADDPRLRAAFDHIVAWQRLDGGWYPNEKCLPGAEREKEPSCPFGTLNILRALGVHPSHAKGKPAKRATEFVLTCWERRKEPFRPIGFGTGKSYLKVQYPFVQWQLLKTLDALSLIPSAHKDKRFQEMIQTLVEKRDSEGTWTPESINKSWDGFDFAQKKQPSPWITFVAMRVLKRIAHSPEKA